MAKQCLKCGYERLETEVAPENECPKCGIIYAKMEARMEQQRIQEFNRTSNATKDNSKEPAPNTGKKLLGVFIIVVFVAILFFCSGKIGFLQWFTTDYSEVVYSGEYVIEKKISNGERVDLKEHIEPDRYTVFFFYADW